ncbi:peptidase inhibitor family I36 protein [Streptomyces clavifer]|uniref:peptidase inhibitor family I36 protein n=1 Tax=Streptomyces clavifer TaxID=68188 RepID=UPI003650BBA3
MEMRKKNIAGVLAALFATGIAGGLVAAAPAQAATTCTTPQACLYYESGHRGAHFRQTGGVTDYATRYFEASTATGSAGAGQTVKNNAESVDNFNPTYRFRVYYNSNYSGAYQTFGTDGSSSASGNLNSTLSNENASGAFVA